MLPDLQEQFVIRILKTNQDIIRELNKTEEFKRKKVHK